MVGSRDPTHYSCTYETSISPTESPEKDGSANQSEARWAWSLAAICSRWLMVRRSVLPRAYS